MLCQLNPYVHRAYVCTPDATQSSPDCIGRCRIIYSRTATFTLYLDFEQLKFHKNSFLFLPANTPYRMGPKTSPTGEAVVIEFDLTSRSAATDATALSLADGGEERIVLDNGTTPYNERYIWFADATHLMEELESFFSTYESSEPYADALCSAKLKIILIKMLANDIAVTKGVTSMRMRRALRYIEAHYAEPITNEEIAASVNLHPYYLSRLLRQECGVGLHKYLHNYRLAVAARMLESSEDNIENIAAQCGFTYASHFVNAFRRAYGMSPRKYAQTHKMKA